MSSLAFGAFEEAADALCGRKLAEHELHDARCRFESRQQLLYGAGKEGHSALSQQV